MFSSSQFEPVVCHQKKVCVFGVWCSDWWLVRGPQEGYRLRRRRLISAPIAEANTTFESKERMYTVDIGTSLNMMEFSLTAGKENHTTDKPGARHFLQREVGGRFVFGVVSWTTVRCAMNWKEYFLLCTTRRKPDTDKRQEVHHVLYRQFRILVAVTQQNVLHPAGTLPAI